MSMNGWLITVAHENSLPALECVNQDSGRYLVQNTTVPPWSSLTRSSGLYSIKLAITAGIASDAATDSFRDALCASSMIHQSINLWDLMLRQTSRKAQDCRYTE
jgi:hypothetical protein